MPEGATMKSDPRSDYVGQTVAGTARQDLSRPVTPIPTANEPHMLLIENNLHNATAITNDSVAVMVQLIGRLFGDECASEKAGHNEPAGGCAYRNAASAQSLVRQADYLRGLILSLEARL